MKSSALLCLLISTAAFAANVRLIRFDESIPFTMGEVTARRVVHPGLGAKKTTLNFSSPKPGAEFAQHVHDYSDDTILVLQGEVNLKQGPSLHLMKQGECAFVPTGQIHGTVTAGTGEAIMISFQNPPDLILYTGARDSKRPGAAQPKGDITPGAVKYVSWQAKQGPFTDMKLGSNRAKGIHRTLQNGEKVFTKVGANGEALLFVWKGKIRVTDGSQTWNAGERDTVFAQGTANLEAVADGPAEIIEVSAP